MYILLADMVPDMTCPECDGELEYRHAEQKIYRPDPETMTDGQLSEQYAAEFGGPFEEGVHGETVHYLQCTSCDYQVVRS